MQFSFESSALDCDLMSEQSLELPPTAKMKKIVMGRSRVTTPAGSHTSGWKAPSLSKQMAPAPAGTASPFRGPGRFFTLNLNDSPAAGAAEVARQSALLMSKMRGGSVPAPPPPGSPRPKGYPGSPRTGDKENQARTQSSSPARPYRAPLTPLRPPPLAGYSPSPVVAAAGVPRRLDSTIDTQVMGAVGGAPRFLTSTCHRPKAAESRLTEVNREQEDRGREQQDRGRNREKANNKTVSDSALGSASQQTKVVKKPLHLKAAALQPKKKPAAIQEEDASDQEDLRAPDLFPALERTDSDNFAPTPPIYRKPEVRKTAAVEKSKKKRAEIDNGDSEEQEDVPAKKPETKKTKASRERTSTNRDSDADLGFGKPPPKSAPKPAPAPPVAVDEEEVTFNFAKPNMPTAKPRAKSATTARSKERGQDAANLTKNYLDLWVPCLKSGKMYIEGNMLDPATGAYFDDRWLTSRITTRISARVVANKKGKLYVLEGSLTVGDMAGKTPIPAFVIDNFMNGFPENWEQLAASWSSWAERQANTTAQSGGGRGAGFIFNSTRLLQTPSHGGGPNVSSLSSLTGLEASRFLAANRTAAGASMCVACPNCTTTFVVGPQGEHSVRQELNTIREEEAADSGEEGGRSKARVRPGSQESRAGGRGAGQGEARSKEQSKGSKQRQGESSSSKEQSRSKAASRSQEKEAAAGGRSSDESPIRSPVKLVEHRSRSKNVKTNFNSTNYHEATISQMEVRKMLSKNYTNFSTCKGKKMYSCNFCEFKVHLFNLLKNHLSSNHLDDLPSKEPSPRKSSKKSNSEPPTPERISKKARRSVSEETVVEKPKRGRLTRKEVEKAVEKTRRTRGARRSVSEETLVEQPKRTGKVRRSISAGNEPAAEKSRKSSKASKESISPGEDDQSMTEAVDRRNAPVQGRPAGRIEWEGVRHVAGKGHYCELCDYTTRDKPAMKKHVATVRHRNLLEASSQHKRKSTTSLSNSPRKQAKKTTSSQSPPRRVSKSPIKNIQKSLGAIPKQTRRSLEKSGDLATASSPVAGSKARTPSFSRTPGLLLYNCFACNYSSDLEAAMRAHVVTPAHGRKAQRAEEGGFLNCDICKFHGSTKGELLKHLESGRHVRKVQPPAVEEVGEETMDQSRYGRKRVKAPNASRKSCVYDTPEFEEDAESDESATKKRKVVKKSKKEKPPKAPAAKEVVKPLAPKVDLKKVDLSLRRVVLNPKKVLKKSDQPSQPKVTKSAEEILKKMSSNPKTVKQRQQNAAAHAELNENHEDDVFSDPKAGKSKSSLFKPISKNLLDDSDSDAEQDVTVCSAKTPVAAYIANKGLRELMLAQDKTPGEVMAAPSHLARNSATEFQQQAFIHKTIAERKKEDRAAKKQKINSALVSKSRAAMDKMVDQSSQVISNLTRNTQPSQGEEETDDWFGE